MRRDAAKGTRYGVIYYGSTSSAMNEAAETLAAKGHHLNMLRIRKISRLRLVRPANHMSPAGQTFR